MPNVFVLQLAGAKRGGMGATRVKTNFAELEQKANLSDQQKDIIVSTFVIQRIYLSMRPVLIERY